MTLAVKGKKIFKYLPFHRRRTETKPIDQLFFIYLFFQYKTTWSKIRVSILLSTAKKKQSYFLRCRKLTYLY